MLPAAAVAGAALVFAVLHGSPPAIASTKTRTYAIAPWHATLAETRHRRLLSAPRHTARPALCTLGRQLGNGIEQIGWPPVEGGRGTCKTCNTSHDRGTDS